MAVVCNCVDRQTTNTDTSTGISSMKVTLCLQCVAVMDLQATFTDTSIRINSSVLQSVAVVDRQATFTDTSTEINSM